MSSFGLADVVYVDAEDITAIHDNVVASTGGLAGIRSGASVEALVSRVQFALSYGALTTKIELAAFYAEAIAQGHIFNDGNKRTAFVVMEYFFRINGIQTEFDPELVADKIVELATKTITYKELAFWIRPYVFEA
ncbi:MAG: type II toxin-antitoxin system death-on-curing family toxin [Maricaulaceae bacterium]